MGIAKDPSYKALLARPVRSILVIKLRAIGDVLISTVVIRNLREAFPDASIDFLTESPALPIIENNLFIDDAVVFRPGKDNPLLFFWKLRQKRYDLVFDLFCNPRSAQMTFATRAPVRVGYPFRGRKYAYNVHVATRADRVHNVEFNLDVLRRAGIPTPHKQPVFSFSDEDKRWAEKFFELESRHKGPLIALNPSGTWESKRWGLDNFASLADMLTEKLAATCVLLWGPGELPDVKTVAGQMKHHAVIPPSTSLRQLGALLSCCDYTISNDSGPMHISAAVGTPTLGIFGPTNPYLQGPLNDRSSWVRLEELDCLACNLTQCGIGKLCMTKLLPEHVYSAFTSLIDKQTATQ